MTGHMEPGPPFRWLRYLLFICIGLAFMACGPSEPVKIGFIGSLSGKAAAMGLAGRDAVAMVVEARNRAGGVAGRRIQLLIRNDRNDPEVARRVTRELIQEGVAAIVGPMTSQMALAMAPVATEAGVVAISPIATTDKLAGRDDYFFRTTSTARQFASAFADFHVKNKTMSRVVTICGAGNREFSENWLQQFTETFERGGGEIIKKLELAPGQTAEFDQVARETLKYNPDGVVVLANSVDTAMICHQIRKLDQNLPISLGGWGVIEVLLELGGKALEGVTLGLAFDQHNTSPSYQQFRQEYREHFGREPDFPGISAFEAASVVLEALNQRAEGEDLKQAILRIRRFHGVQETFSFDDSGDTLRRPIIMSVLRNGEFKTIE